MSDFFIYGEFKKYIITASGLKFIRRQKWRSQVSTNQNGQPYGVEGDLWYVSNDIPIVQISDVDFETRAQYPIDNSERVYKIQSDRRLPPNPSQYVTYGKDAFSIDAAFVRDDTLDATNPNGDRFADPVPTAKPVTEPQYISFAEARLELGYDYGAVGGPSFATEVIEVADDREQRNATKLLPLGRWQLGDRLIADSELNKLDEVSYLKQFHLDRLGCFEGFRFKDWADYQAFDQYIATGDGVKTQFQLRKAYYAGDAVTYRPILKPVPGTVALFVDNVRVPDISEDPSNGWHINNETGVVTGNLASGARLTTNFEFDVPVWFESDSIDFRLEYYDPQTTDTVYRLGSVFVVESPLPPSIPIAIKPSQQITEELDLGIIYETTENYQLSNNKLPLKSGYTRRENKRDDNRIAFNLGSRNYNRSELDKLLGYFWNAKGKNKEWPFTNLGKNYKVRFNEDRLNLKFLAAQGNEALFDLSGLKIQVKEEIIFTFPTLPTFALSETFFDFGLDSSDNSQQLNSAYSESGGSGSAGGSGSGSGSGGGSSGGGAGAGGSSGIGGGFADIPFTIPSGFTPYLVSELNGYPILIGEFGFLEVAIATPIFPYDGTFQVSRLGFSYATRPNQGYNLIRVRNGRAYCLIYYRNPQGGNRLLAIEITQW